MSDVSLFKRATAQGANREKKTARYGIYDPDGFRERFPAAKPLTDSTFFEKVFGTGVSTHNQSLIPRSGAEWFPNVFSTTLDHVKFVRELAETLNNHIKPTADEEGFTNNGIHTNFNRLKTVANWGMSKMSYPMLDNASFRKSLGLRVGMTPREVAIATEMWDLVFKNAKMSSVHVSPISTTGMRQFTRDAQYKLDFIQFLFSGDHFERILNFVDKNDYIGLANEFDTVFAFYIQRRGQVDEPGKKRFVRTLRWILSGGEGELEEADKSVVIDGSLVSDFSAMRLRVVHAGPWTINGFLQFVSTVHMQALFELFPNTFHVNTSEQIENVVRGKWVYCSDVSEYDASMDWSDIELMHQRAAEVWDARIVKASRRLYCSPYYARPMVAYTGAKQQGRWIGDPRDWSAEQHSGNKSGHAFTSLVAKVMKVIDTMIVIDRIVPLVGNVAAFLRGELPTGLINNGDDEVVWFRSRALLEQFKKLREVKSDIGRYVVEPELGQGFSGLLLTRKGQDDLDYKAVPKVHSPLEKMVCPERSIGGDHRPYYTIGFFDRISNLQRSEEGREAWSIFISCWGRRMAPIYGDFMSVLAREHAKIKRQVEALTQADREVIEDPDKLHYKYKEGEISASILAAVSSNVPKDVVYNMCRKYYAGNIM